MPTGYTADVQAGKVTSFREFALQCARAFGACVMQRDDNFNDPPKLREAQNSYHIDGLKDAKAELKKLNKMTDKAIQKAIDLEYKESYKQYQDQLAKYKIERKRYETMLVKVKEWMPPSSEHVGLKDFMIQQITDSISWDCDPKYDKCPTKLEPKEWLQNKIKSVEYDIEYHTKKINEENVRVDNSNFWIKSLYASLPKE